MTPGTLLIARVSERLHFPVWHAAKPLAVVPRRLTPVFATSRTVSSWPSGCDGRGQVSSVSRSRDTTRLHRIAWCRVPPRPPGCAGRRWRTHSARCVAEGPVEIGIVADIVDFADLEIHPFAIDQFVVIAPREHPVGDHATYRTFGPEGLTVGLRPEAALHRADKECRSGDERIEFQ